MKPGPDAICECDVLWAECESLAAALGATMDDVLGSCRDGWLEVLVDSGSICYSFTGRCSAGGCG
jgi:hypothetical protein